MNGSINEVQTRSKVRWDILKLYFLEEIRILWLKIAKHRSSIIKMAENIVIWSFSYKQNSRLSNYI